jgi:hypothetical protein
MSKRLETLAARRELLVARGAVQRARAALEAGRLRESLHWRRSVATFAASSSGRSALMGTALFLLGGSRAGRFLRAAALAIAAFRLARSLARARGSRRHPAS